MLENSYSNFHKKREKTLSSISYMEKDSPYFGSCMAISPDSQRIVTFSPETYNLKLYYIDDLTSIKNIFTLKCDINEVNYKRLCWSIAISNCVGNERLIALSWFDAEKFRHDDKVNKQSGNNEIDIQTWVISTNGKEINTSLKSIGGVIRFLDSDNSDFPYDPRLNDSNYPQQLSISLSRDPWQNSFELLHTSIIKSFENRHQIIEMYSLITGNLEILFKRHEPSVTPNIIRGSSIFAISQNEKILAFCRGTISSITLYSMENGLEIATKQLEGQRGIYKITAIYFIDDDSKLFIILEEKEYLQVEILKRQIFVVWDLFTTFENSIRQIDYSETATNPLKTDVTYRLMNSHGKIFAFRDSKDIFSVLDHPDAASIRKPSEKTITNFNKILPSGITRSDHDYHVIYTVDGKKCDTPEKNQIIINNVEPWHPNKHYFRISVFLDSDKRTQLIISQNTIQVWKYRTNPTIGKRDKHERVLEYIWARNKVIEVQKLKCREREFVLKVLVPSTKQSTPKTMKIHWPNNVNVLEGACRALYVLEEKKHKHSIASFENVDQIEYLGECIQGLVRKYITKYGIFRLTSIRYPIMKYLIKSYQENLIKHILNKKINKKNSNIYIPKSYKWGDKSTTEISKSDLHHAILCIQNRGDSTVILNYLIDYYTDNAKEYNHYGWMFTVSEALPLLYDCRLSELVRYLFKKPCFGITEAYTPPLRLNSYDQKEGNNAAKQKFHNSPWFFLKNLFTRTETSHKDHKVYIVPLPDFTVYPDQDPEPDGLEDRELVRYLFKKPCFGITEAYTPPLRLNSYDQKEGNNAAKQKFHNSPWFFLKNLFTRTETSHKDHKVYIVPLPDFTVYPDQDPEPDGLEDRSENYSKYFWFLFTLFRISLLPRRKVIKNTKKMSPFLRVINEEKSYEIYQTPTIMAVLDFKWSAARRYFIRHFVMYIFYAISFLIAVIPYSDAILKISLFVYFYTGWYLIATEIVQLLREGCRRYINIYYMFDLGSLLLPLANMAFILHDRKVFVLQNKVSNSILAFTVLVMWLQLLLLLRYFEGPGRFIHIVKSILNTIWLFFVVMLIVVLAFGHAMFILIKYADDIQIPTYKIKDTSNSDLFSNITISQNFDKSSRLDNYYSHFLSSVKAVFFWTNGRWDQLDQWNSYPVDVMSLLGSIILVLIFQNMLIAFMNAAFDKANKAGHAVAYTYRAELVAEYEALEKPFDSKRGSPRYIYYIPDPDVITCLTKTKKVENQKLRLTSTDSDFSDGDDDCDDCDDNNDETDDNEDDGDKDDNDNNDDDNNKQENEDSSSLLPIDLAKFKKKCTTMDSFDSNYGIIDKISFIDEEIFPLKITSKLNKKSRRNQGSYKNEHLSKDPVPTIIVGDQLLVHERLNNLENGFKKFETKLDQNLETILKTLNNLK
ncbi:hypothetical protein Glove_57g94 [Diversispora epigaea]|uniref:Ion transport domain-containing protein n=1 Tax=Diversispora epigaea TaxID=1348612 RepID=A0A397JCA0_9GLOM|nr:hypothetical protein Glove_57g94 [Diversispora epigaea]